VVRPNTIVKAYSELEHEGLLDFRPGSGAFVCVKRRTKSLATQVQIASEEIRGLLERLKEDGLSDEEIRTAFEAELLYPSLPSPDREKQMHEPAIFTQALSTMETPSRFGT